MQVTPELRHRSPAVTSQRKAASERQQQKNIPKYWKTKYWLKVLKNTGSIIIVVYLIIPIWFCVCPWLRRQCIFLNNFNWPPFETSNLSLPQRWGIHNALHFFIDSEPGIHLGVWHIPPKSKANIRYYDDFSSDRPIIMYLHGNSMNRAAAYRRSLYKVLTESEIDAHVITFDYRGYGDSTYVSPSVAGLVADGEAMYSWLKQRVNISRIFLWGHSLGSGVTVQLAAKLTDENNPAGIILESSFTSISDATHSFPLSILHRFMPFFDTFFSKPTRHIDTNFNSDEKVHLISAPMLMLHAADDDMVAVELGRTLHEKARRRLSRKPLQYVEFNSSLAYGHLNIHRAPELPTIVVQFMNSVKSPSKLPNK